MHKTIKYANGDIYEGEWIRERIGLGNMRYGDDGRDYYEGRWYNSIKYGQGKMIYANGNVYEGEWKDDERNGQGNQTYGDDGRVYEGQWANDKMNGQGKLTYANGDVYEGEWKDNKMNGQGKLTYANGDVYEGYWYDNNRHSQGIMRYANGDVYEGNWYNSIKYGQGKLTYANSDVYEGLWRNNYEDGLGKMIYANGNIYEGNWKLGEDEDEHGNIILKGMPHGHGKMIYANGDVYEGNSFYGTLSDQGTMRYVNGDIYIGQWDGDRYGQGTMRYANGDVYEGNWQNDAQNGQGRMTYANGTISDGIWDDGVIVQAQVPHPGVAFEIHNAADKINMVKYYELIKIDEHYADIDMIEYIKDNLKNIIREKMPEKEATLNAILTKAKNLINANKVFVGRTIDYVMKQPDAFKELYIASFIMDCSQAYEGEHQMSCAKGIFERINMSLIPPLTVISSECDETNEDCVKYKNLFRLLTQTINIQDIIKDWANKPDIQDMSAKERKEDLIAFITSKYVELGMTPPTEMIQAKADELDYVFKDLAWGGRKHGTTRRTKKHGTKRRTRKHVTKRKMKKN